MPSELKVFVGVSLLPPSKAKGISVKRIYHISGNHDSSLTDFVDLAILQVSLVF